MRARVIFGGLVAKGNVVKLLDFGFCVVGEN